MSNADNAARKNLETGMKALLKGVWAESKDSGWPVNVRKVALGLFGGDEQSVLESYNNVKAECERLGFMKVTFEGNTFEISEAAKLFAGLK